MTKPPYFASVFVIPWDIGLACGMFSNNPGFEVTVSPLFLHHWAEEYLFFSLPTWSVVFRFFFLLQFTWGVCHIISGSLVLQWFWRWKEKELWNWANFLKSRSIEGPSRVHTASHPGKITVQMVRELCVIQQDYSTKSGNQKCLVTSDPRPGRLQKAECAVWCSQHKGTRPRPARWSSTRSTGFRAGQPWVQAPAVLLPCCVVAGNPLHAFSS